jgi:hypothetical protein
MTSIVRADGVVVIPPHGSVPEGGDVEVEMFA